MTDKTHGVGLCVEQSKYAAIHARAALAEAELATCREQLRLANIDSMNAEAELERLRAGIREALATTNEHRVADKLVWLLKKPGP